MRCRQPVKLKREHIVTEQVFQWKSRGRNLMPK